MPLPTVTFIIPCFNHGRYVREAVDSCLAQRDADVRVVVLDDGSDDGHTPRECDACAGPLVDVVHQANAGPAAARNAGAALAKSEFIAFLDADDIVDPQFTCALSQAMAQSDAPDQHPISHAYCEEIVSGIHPGYWAVPDWDPQLLLITNLHPVTTLLRRSAFEAAGGFDVSISGYEDWELWIRLRLRGFRAIRVQQPLFTWRRHSVESRVVGDVARHDELYAQIIERHQTAYAHHAVDLLKRSNAMLRRFDCNFLDKSGLPYSLLYLWACRDRLHQIEPRVLELEGGLAQSQATVAQLELQLAEARAALCAARAESAALAEWYEQLLGVRLHRRVKSLLDHLPGPIRAAAQRSLVSSKRFVKPGPPPQEHSRPA